VKTKWKGFTSNQERTN